MAKKITEGSIDGIDSTPKKVVKSKVTDSFPMPQFDCSERLVNLESKINELVELNMITKPTSIPTDNELKEIEETPKPKQPQNHFLNNWKTSLCGLMLIIFGIIGRGKELINSTEAIGFITMGIGLLLGKDYDVVSRK
jgi:hypothetical protein